MIPTSVQFWTYLLPYVPSVICSLFVLYHLFFHRKARLVLNNHVPALLLLIGLASQLTVYPWMFHFFLQDSVWQRSPLFCSVWGLLDWGVYCTQNILFAWGTIERHILIFHDKWLKKKLHCFLLHYLPLIMILVYCSIYYGNMYLFPPQPNSFDDTLMFCVQEYLLNETRLVLYDTIVHQIAPVFIIIVFSMLLLIRVVWIRSRLHQRNHWHRHRKMTIQLLSIAVVYSVFAVPYSFYYILVLSNVSETTLDEWYSNTHYLTYFPILFTPFVCLASSNESRRQLRRWIVRLRARRGAVAPATQVHTTQR